MAIYRGPGGAGDATNDATSQAILAAGSAQQSAASATASATSASQASTSATNAANSATTAASSANSASTSATNAANSATAAQTAQTAAELAETNAETAEANAETAEANATTSAALAQEWATKTSGPVVGGEYSSKYNAQLAATSATNAANSATSASTSAFAASTSATNAASSATAAASSATAAAASAASINPADLVHISGTETITGAKTFSTNPTISSGTANGVAYLNGSKVLTTGSALTFDGGSFSVNTAGNFIIGKTTGYDQMICQPQVTGSGIVQFVLNNAGNTYQPLTTDASYFTWRPNGGEQMRLTSTGLGIGTSSPSYKLDVVQSNGNGYRTTYNGISLINFIGSDCGYTGTSTNHPLAFVTNGSERMRIDSSGNLLVGSTVNNPSNAGKLYVSGNFSGGGVAGISIATTTTANAQQIVFHNQNGAVGSINTNGSTTTYNTSSDYRLKENIQPMQNALEFVRKQRPVTYNWKDDGSKGSGYIAHWMKEDGAGNCVTGEKDAVDIDGKPVYQGIDTSFMVAPLNAAINELADMVDAQKELIVLLKAELDATKAEVVALKGV